MLPKEIQLDQKFNWEMALVELFWPKHNSVAVIENLWYETQGPNRRWKRTYVPSSAFLSVTSQRVSFHLVLPSSSSHETFLENHAGKLT